jgi:hypothetical protein
MFLCDLFDAISSLWNWTHEVDLYTRSLVLSHQIEMPVFEALRITIWLRNAQTNLACCAK